MGAYALARIEYAPKFGTILLFVASMLGMAVGVGVLGVDWRLASAVAVVVFVLLARALGRRFKRSVGNGDILFWMISQRILPPVVVIIPIYMMFQSVRLLDTHFALILAYTVVNLPIVVWLMHDFFSSIPIDLEESAQLDGASRFTIFAEIVLPQARGLAATTLLVLILSWNEYLLALFLSTRNAQTMPILVAGMNAGEKGILWWTMCRDHPHDRAGDLDGPAAAARFIAKGILLGAVKDERGRPRTAEPRIPRPEALAQGPQQVVWRQPRGQGPRHRGRPASFSSCSGHRAAARPRLCE